VIPGRSNQSCEIKSTRKLRNGERRERLRLFQG
jgi:MoxR-like ATPase